MEAELTPPAITRRSMPAMMLAAAVCTPNGAYERPAGFRIGNGA